MVDEQPDSGGFFDGVRFAASELLSRFRFSGQAGITYGGKRDIYKVLGYKRDLFPRDYRERYERDGVAARIVDAYPNDTWRGGADLVEDDDPETLTEFEEAWNELAKRLKVWSVFERADILAGLGRYAVIVIVAPGEPDTPLPKNLESVDIKKLQPYSEEDAVIATYDEDPKSERFGYPTFYTVQRVSNNQTKNGVRVHYSRVIHISDGLLDDNVFGIPRLKKPWNRLDDLEKVQGGGAEAFWIRANQGTQFNLDKDFKWPANATERATAQQQMRDDIEEFVHGISRVIRTKGMDIETLGSDVADFSRPADSIYTSLAAMTGIPKRILMGSERGELASTTDKTTWDQRVADRRLKFAGPYVIEEFVTRLTEHGALPEVEYEIKWLEAQDLDDNARADLANKWANINKAMGETVVTGGEIRDRVLGLAPLEESVSPEELELIEKERENKLNPPVPGGFGAEDETDDEETEDEDEPAVAASRVAPEPWEAIHRAADRSATSMATSFRKSIQKTMRSVTLAELEAAAAQGPDFVDALVARSLATEQPKLQSALTKVLTRTLLAGAKVARKQLNG